MDLANELFRADPSSQTVHATRASTNLPPKTISEQYKDLMRANRIPEERNATRDQRRSSSSLIWDDDDLRQAQLEPEFEEAHEAALQSNDQQDEDELQTSDEDTCLLYTSPSPRDRG